MRVAARWHPPEDWQMAELLREQEVAYLVTGPEGQTLEWKNPRIHPRDLATTLIAFANADGGRLLIGHRQRHRAP